MPFPALKQYQSLIFILFSLHALLIIVLVGLNLAGIQNITLDAFVLWTTPVLVLAHALISLGCKPGLAFWAITIILGTLTEALGLSYGLIFGSGYAYNCQTQLCLISVPITVPLYWFVFIYTGYSLARFYGSNASSRWSIPMLSAVFTLSIDLALDPVMVGLKKWHWLENGFYFNIPFGNFTGWFIVAYFSVLLFMAWQDKSADNQKKPWSDFELIPVAGYYILLTFLGSLAIKQRCYTLTLIILLIIAISLAVKIFSKKAGYI
jgi:bisanhydrobacterioruberin hydratase